MLFADQSCQPGPASVDERSAVRWLPGSRADIGQDVGVEWFSVRCVFQFSEGTFEERVTIWQADDFDGAIRLAEEEAEEYACALDDSSEAEYLGLAQAFKLFDEPGHGAEVFSLLRDSNLEGDQYIQAFFDTGSEHQGLAE